MRITIDLTTDESLALRRFMAEYDRATPEDALAALMRDWLIGHGYLELQYEMEEDTETAGEA